MPLRRWERRCPCAVGRGGAGEGRPYKKDDNSHIEQELSPSTNLTANEIAAARLATQSRTFNPQQQYPVSWPDAPVVARAYLDQLLRDGSVGKDAAASLAAVLDKAEARLDAGKRDAGVAAELRIQAGQFAGAAAGTRQVKLARVIDAIAAKLS